MSKPNENEHRIATMFSSKGGNSMPICAKEQQPTRINPLLQVHSLLAKLLLERCTENSRGTVIAEKISVLTLIYCCLDTYNSC
jgi:hypothetical protein